MAIDFTGLPIDNNLLSRIDAPIGTYRQSDLTLEQFLSETPGVWVLADGQPCTGSEYELKTGKSNVPDLVTDGRFLRPAKNGVTPGTVEDDAQQNITGAFSFTDDGSTGMRVRVHSANGAFVAQSVSSSKVNSSGVPGASTTAGQVAIDASRQVRTADEVRPKSIAVNTFIKIGY